MPAAPAPPAARMKRRLDPSGVMSILFVTMASSSRHTIANLLHFQRPAFELQKSPQEAACSPVEPGVRAVPDMFRQRPDPRRQIGAKKLRLLREIRRLRSVIACNQ